MKIAIAGTGCLGLSNAVLLAQKNEVVAIDIVPEKVAMLNRKQSPIVDLEIEDYLQRKPLDLRATLDKFEAYEGVEFVIIATPHRLRSRDQHLQHEVDRSGHPRRHCDQPELSDGDQVHRPGWLHGAHPRSAGYAQPDLLA